jgi:hypothetical protein
MNARIRIIVASTSVVMAMAGLSACGGTKSSASGGSATAPASATAAASGSATTGRGGFGAEFDNPKVVACLKAAGITVPARPSGSFSRGARPSGSYTRPSGAVRPSGSRGAGGFGGANGTKIQAALKACGITLPTGGFRRIPSGTAVPTATPSTTS